MEKSRERKTERETQTERDRGKRRSGEKRETEAASLRERWKGRDSAWNLKISLPQQLGEEVGVACILRDRAEHYIPISFYNNKVGS